MIARRARRRWSIVTEWDMFRALDFQRLGQLMRSRPWSTCATSTVARTCGAVDSPISGSGLDHLRASMR